MGTSFHDDRHLFEMLILEGAQGRLSWSTILHKRANYQKHSHRSTPKRLPASTAKRRAVLMNDAGIVRNRLKIDSNGDQCQAFLQVQKGFGSFDRYLWGFVEGKPMSIFALVANVAREHGSKRPDFQGPEKRGFSLLGTTTSTVSAGRRVVNTIASLLSCPKARKAPSAVAARKNGSGRRPDATAPATGIRGRASRGASLAPSRGRRRTSKIVIQPQ